MDGLQRTLLLTLPRRWAAMFQSVSSRLQRLLHSHLSLKQRAWASHGGPHPLLGRPTQLSGSVPGPVAAVCMGGGVLIPCQRGRVLPFGSSPPSGVGTQSRHLGHPQRRLRPQNWEQLQGLLPERNDKHQLLQTPSPWSPTLVKELMSHLRGSDQELASLPASSSLKNGRVFLFTDVNPPSQRTSC